MRRSDKGKLKTYKVIPVGLVALGMLTLTACQTSTTAANPSTNTKATTLEAPVSKDLANAFPHSWSQDAAGPTHNAAFSAPSNGPQGLLKGYSWKFPEIHAVPLNQMPPGTSVVGQLRASVRLTQTVGNSLGVTAVDGNIYAESDSGVVYDLNAATGKLIWQHTLTNEAMGNPVVENGMVYFGTGNSSFSFRELLNYKTGKPVMRGTGENYIYALDAKTGKTVWKYYTNGEDMPTPAYLNGVLYEANGEGNILALDAKTGKLLWKQPIGGFNSMSSPVAWVNPKTGQGEVLASFSNPDKVVAVSAKSGAILWTQSIPGSFDTGMSDEVPVVDPTTNTVIVNSVIDPKMINGAMTVNLAMEALDGTTGKVLWLTKFGRGSMPPAFKAGVPMIHNGIVYMSAPATDSMHAVDLKTGKVLWGYKAGYPGRAAPTYYKGTLYFDDGPMVFALNPKTGAVISKKKIGGLFGIVNPVIVGGTMYLDNSYNWIMAVPLKDINPSAQS